MASASNQKFKINSRHFSTKYITKKLVEHTTLKQSESENGKTK